MDPDEYTEKFGQEAEHLKEELSPVVVAREWISRWQHRYIAATRELGDHMKHCGICINQMIKSGALIKLEEWWEMGNPIFKEGSRGFLDTKSKDVVPNLDDLSEKLGPQIEHVREEFARVRKAETRILGWQRRYESGTRKVESHMKYCGRCINMMIRSGTLVKLEEWWTLIDKTGECDPPRLRNMCN